MDNVTVLPGVARNVADTAPCVETIEILQRWLDKARKGEIVGVALAAVGPTRWTVSEWGGSASRNDILASTTILQTRMLHGVVSE